MAAGGVAWIPVTHKKEQQYVNPEQDLSALIYYKNMTFRPHNTFINCSHVRLTVNLSNEIMVCLYL